MKKLLFLLLLPLSLSATPELILRPYEDNGWMKDQPLSPVKITLQDNEYAGAQTLFFRIDALLLRVSRRMRAHNFWLELTDEEEPPLSDAAVRFELCWLGSKYPFNHFGRLHLDERFIDDDDAELLTQFQTFYANIFKATPFAQKKPTEIKKRRQPTPEELPVFYGYEDARYQKHDALILKLVAEFNANPAAWAGVDEGRKVTIPKLDPALIKSLMIEETGGGGPRSLAAWEKDPLQVNVPGDWSDAKRLVGLKRPKNRNEGSLENNLRAGIKFLVRKGFGVSAMPVGSRKDVYFDSWRTALRRYNGRKDLIHDGRSYRVAYAARIQRRVSKPNVYIPIATDRQRKKKR